MAQRWLWLGLVLLLFCLGAVFYAGTGEGVLAEGFARRPRCPDKLIQRGSRFFLYNARLAEVPGVNPIVFDHLEDYTEFLAWQKSQGIHCPVLYLQETYDTQGNLGLRALPDVHEPQGGLPPVSA